MNLDDFNIGIEIEYIDGSTFTVSRNIQRAGLSCELVPYGRCHATHSGWIVTTDQTVSRNICYSTGRANGGEVVSPKLKYRDAIAQVETVCDAINRTDSAGINRNCGLHISVSWPNMTAAQVRNVVKRYKKFEGEIDAFMPPSRRANRNRWCGSLNGASWVSRVVNSQGDSLSQLREGGKMVKLNLMNLGGGERSRLEFRHHSGTTDARKIINWIQFVCQFIKSAQMSGGIQTRYRAAKPAWFADIREQLANVGIETKWSRALAEDGANGMTFHANGMQLAALTYNEMVALYQYGANNKGRRAMLNDDFLALANNMMQRANIQASTDTGLYHGLTSDVAQYFTSRTQQLTSTH